jgi:hypothetical protein
MGGVDGRKGEFQEERNGKPVVGLTRKDFLKHFRKKRDSLLKAKFSQDSRENIAAGRAFCESRSAMSNEIEAHST